jgi:hypothetical protein
VCSGRKGLGAPDPYNGWSGAPSFEPAGPPRFSRPKGRVRALRDRELCYRNEVETPSVVMPEPISNFPDFVLWRSGSVPRVIPVFCVKDDDSNRQMQQLCRS